MKDAIALALIKRLVANGQLDADDILQMGKELSDYDRALIQAAWIEGAVGPDEEFKPVLKIVE